MKSFFFTIIISLVFSLCPSISFSEDTATDGQDQISSPSDSTLRLADEIRANLSERVIALTNSVDALFGTERLDEESKNSRARIRVGFELNEGGGFDIRQGANIALDLPKTERRLQLLFTNTLEGRESSPFGDGIQTPTTDDTFQSGLRYFLFSQGPARVNIDGGLKWNGGITPFVQLRGRYIFADKDWAITPTQFIFWRRKDGEFGESSRLYIDRKITGQTLLRLRTEGTLSQDSDGLEYNQSLTSYTQERETWGYSFGALIQGASGEPIGVGRYQLLALYRSQFYRDWLFLQLGPVATFEYDRDWRLAPGFLVQFESVIGNLSDPIKLW